MINTVVFGGASVRQIDITSTTHHSDTAEKEVERFVQDGCGSSTMCSAQFSATEYTAIRNSCNDLLREEMDLFLMGELSATTFDSSCTRVGSRHPQTTRQRPKSCFRYRGKKVNNRLQCLKLLMFKSYHCIRFAELRSCFWTTLASSASMLFVPT